MRSLTTILLFALAVLAVVASSSWAGVPCVGTTDIWAEKDSTVVCETIEIYIILRDCYGQPLSNRVVTFYTDIDDVAEYTGNPAITDVSGFAQATIHVPYPDEEWRTLEDEYSSYLFGNCQGVALGGTFPLVVMNVAWLTTPVWDIALTSYGYSDRLLAHKPVWRRAWPWNQWWVEEDKLSGEWAAAIWYNGINTPPISQGPNVGQPQSMWLEPNFVYPDWVTNSGFWVTTPIAVWNRGELPLPYMDTGMSEISNGQVTIRIDYLIHDDRTAMGRHSVAGNMPFTTWTTSDRYILQQTYTITNVSGATLNNVELTQFLHGHATDGDETGVWGDWEVYDPTPWTTPPGDNWGDYHYDITQGGRYRLLTWPWPYGYWRWFNWDWIGFHSDVPPTEYRSPFGWGLGPYRGHVPGKPARPGVHWSVEEDNLNGWGPNVVWPAVPAGLPVVSVPGDEVAGAETWYLGSLGNGNNVQHDVLLTIANRPYGGWHWGWDWWFWYDSSWPHWDFPSVFWGPHHLGHPYYKCWIDIPWWWFCCNWPPAPNNHWVGVSIPDVEVARGVDIEGVYFKEYAPDSGGVTLAEFMPDLTVTSDLETNYPWAANSWYGFSLDGYVLPDSQMIVYLEIRDPDQELAGKVMHVMMGDSLTGWAEYHYDSLIVCSPGSSGIPTDKQPSEFMLARVYPNPFSATTQIQYALPEASEVSLAIYTIAGQHVRTLVSKYQAPGSKVVRWDGTNDSGMEVTGGIYFCKFTAGEFTALKKIVVAR